MDLIRKPWWLIFFLLGVYGKLHSQRIEGWAKTETGDPATDCYVLAIDPATGTILEYEVLSDSGYFSIQITGINLAQVILRCQGLTYQPVEKTISFSEKKSVYSVQFTLRTRSFELEETVVISTRPKIVINNDTIRYDAAQYAQNNDLKVLDLLRRLPGIEVNEQTGEVRFKGQPIETLLIDGEDIFGKGYSLGVRNIPLRVVDQVEAIQDYHPNRLEKGLRRSERVALNLKLKKGIGSLSGDVALGGGPGAYVANANVILLHSAHKGFGSANANNASINETSFSPETYSREHSEEMEHYAFDPLQRSRLNEAPSFERAYQNRLVSGAYAHRTKLGERSSIRASLGVFRDRQPFEWNSESRFSINGSDFFNQSDALKGTSAPEFNTLDLEWNTNLSDSSLFKNELRLVGHSLNTRHSNLQNGNAHYLSSLGSNRLLGLYKGHYSYRISPVDLLDFKGYYSRDKLDQSLSIPGDIPFTFRGVPLQHAEYRNRRTDAGLSASWLKKWKAWDMQWLARVDAKEERFFSAMESQPDVFDYSRHGVGVLGIINHPIGKRATLQALPEGRYFFQKAQNHATNEVLEATAFAWNARIRMEWAIGEFGKLMVRAVKNSVPAASQYLYRAQVLADTRTAISNIPSLALQNQWQAGIDFRRDDLSNQRNQSISAGFQLSDNNFLAVQEVDSLITSLTFFQSPAKKKAFNLNGSHSFLVYRLSTLFTFGLNTSAVWFVNQMNEGILSQTFSSSYQVHSGWNTAFDGPVNFRLQATWAYYFAKQVGLPAIRNQFMRTEFIAFFQITPNGFLRLTNQALFPQESVGLWNQNFFDVHMEYRLPTYDGALFLLARNIFNRSHFLQVHTTEFSRTVVSTRLFDPYLVVGMNLSFPLKGPRGKALGAEAE